MKEFVSSTVLNSITTDRGHIVYVDFRFDRRKRRDCATSRNLCCPFEGDRTFYSGARQKRGICISQTGSRPYSFCTIYRDGDCQLAATWVDAALSFIENQLDVAVVCGRRRERYPERSIYNQLCDIEWDTPLGETSSCGGDALMRVEAFGGGASAAFSPS